MKYLVEYVAFAILFLFLGTFFYEVVIVEDRNRIFCQPRCNPSAYVTKRREQCICDLTKVVK